MREEKVPPAFSGDQRPLALTKTLSEASAPGPHTMRVQVHFDGEQFDLQCGNGMQRVAWVSRVAAQRLSSGGIWCAPEHEVGRPKEFIPGKVFLLPNEEEIDQEATIISLLESEVAEEETLAFKVDLRDSPAHGLPSLAARGSEDAVVPPKNAKAAVSYQMTLGENGRIVTRTPAPLPAPHQGYDFGAVLDNLTLDDITKGCDPMVVSGVRNVLSNSFAPLVDIFLHYASPKQKEGVDAPEEEELAINMKSFAKFVRTCRLSSEVCSFFEIQRASVRPQQLLPSAEEEWSLGIYDADYNLYDFFEALVRIANIKDYGGLTALCDQLNKLIHTQILPFATGDDEDRIRDLTQRHSVQMIFFHQRNGLRKFYSKRLKLEKNLGARSISLAEFIACLKTSSQIEEELTTAAVKEIWLATLSFDIPPDSVTEDDKNLEVTLSELEEIMTRCVLQRSKVAEDNLPQQTDLFLKKFLRSNL